MGLLFTGTFDLNGGAWSYSYDDRGWYTATDGTAVIMERGLAQLKDACSRNDSANPRIDAVAFADPLPGIGVFAGLN